MHVALLVTKFIRVQSLIVDFKIFLSRTTQVWLCSQKQYCTSPVILKVHLVVTVLLSSLVFMIAIKIFRQPITLANLVIMLSLLVLQYLHFFCDIVLRSRVALAVSGNNSLPKIYTSEQLQILCITFHTLPPICNQLKGTLIMLTYIPREAIS